MPCMNNQDTPRITLSEKAYYKPSYIYLMLDERTKFIKIGRTINPPVFREQTLQSDNPLITLIFSMWTLSGLEGDLHKKYANQRIRGEWFSLSDQDLIDVKRTIHKQAYCSHGDSYRGPACEWPTFQDSDYAPGKKPEDFTPRGMQTKFDSMSISDMIEEMDQKIAAGKK